MTNTYLYPSSSRTTAKINCFMPHMGKGNGISFLMSCFIWVAPVPHKNHLDNGWNANHSSFGKKNKVMTATIWHRHDKTAVLKNEEGFFSYSKLPIFICHTICRCMKCESSSSRYVIDVRAKKLTQQCYAGKLTPWRRQYHGWNPFLTQFENMPKKVSFHYNMRFLVMGALKSPLRCDTFFSGNLSLKSPLILSFFDVSFDIMGNCHTCTAISVALLFFKLWILGCF